MAGFTIVLYLALLAAAFFILIVRPQRRQMATRRALIASLEVGDEVITAGGIYGTILEISDTEMQIEVAPTVVLKMAREAVSARPHAANAGASESQGAGDGDRIGEDD